MKLLNSQELRKYINTQHLFIANNYLSRLKHFFKHIDPDAHVFLFIFQKIYGQHFVEKHQPKN